MSRKELDELDVLLDEFSEVEVAGKLVGLRSERLKYLSHKFLDGLALAMLDESDTKH